MEGSIRQKQWLVPHSWNYNSSAEGRGRLCCSELWLLWAPIIPHDYLGAGLQENRKQNRKQREDCNRVFPNSLWIVWVPFPTSWASIKGLLLNSLHLLLCAHCSVGWEILEEKNGKFTTNSSVNQRPLLPFAWYFSESSKSCSIHPAQVLFNAKHEGTVTYFHLIQTRPLIFLKSPKS